MPDEIDGVEFEDMWSDAAAAEETGDNPEFETIETGANLLVPDELDTDVVEGETVPPVADKPTEASDEWDWSANADKLVPIKVRGEETQVPLKELRDGYMRQQDYTRGTQEIAQLRNLAQWAQDVQRGFESDPEGMIEAFERSFKIQRGPQTDPLADIDEDLRPVYQQNLQLQQELAALREQQEAFRQEQVVAGVRRELEQLQTKHGEAFDPKETILVAQHYNLPLEEAHYLRIARLGQLPQAQPSPPTAPAVGAEVADAAAQAAEATRLAGKATAQGTLPKGKFKASEIAVTEFNDIGELFELVAQGSDS